MFAPKSRNEIIHGILDRLEEHTPFTNTAPESRSRQIAEAISAQLALMYVDMALLEESISFSRSKGSFIDEHAELLGVAREPGESDENYKYRVKNALDSIGGRESAIMLKALSLPIVKSAHRKLYTHGSGSFSIIVLPHSVEQMEEAVAQVQAAIEPIVAPGIRAVVRGPKKLLMEIELVTSLKRNVSEEMSRQIRRDIQSAVKAYIDGLDLGRPLVISQLMHRAHQASEDIEAINIVSMHSNGRPLLTRDVRPHWDEKFFVSHISDIVVM